MTQVLLSGIDSYESILTDGKGWPSELDWVPVSTSELHLASRYFPLAVSVSRSIPRLGLIVSQRYLTYQLHNSKGEWLGAYRPIGVRSFPFAVDRIGTEPLADLLVEREKLPQASQPPSSEESDRRLAELHRLCCLLKRSEETLAPALDRLLIAGVLTPLVTLDSDPTLHAIAPEKLAQIGQSALAALGRHGFASLDIAIAAVFSIRNLKPQFRPANPAAHIGDSALASVLPDPIDHLDLLLDDSELIDPYYLDGIRLEPSVFPSERPAAP